MSKLRCACGRPIPIPALWSAFARKRPLSCTECGASTSLARLPDDADVAGDHARSALTIYQQLIRFGWTSYDAVRNAIAIEGDPRMVSGLLAGLERAGLLTRVCAPTPVGTNTAFAGLIVAPKVVYIPGPEFPQAED